MAKVLYVDGLNVNIGVRDREEAEEIILKIILTYATWVAERYGGPAAEERYERLVGQFSAQEKYAYELPLTELRRTGEMGQWTPGALRLYVSEHEGEFPLVVLIRDNGGWDAAPAWVPPELRT